MKLRVPAILVALWLSASAALAVEVVILQDPTHPDQYFGHFDAQFIESGEHIPTWEFVSPVAGTLSFQLRVTGGLVEFIGYQFDHGPVTSFTTFTGNDPLVTGIQIDPGPHSLLVGYRAAPQLPPRMPASGGFMGLFTIVVSPIPEPQTWVLMALGLTVTGLARARKVFPAGKT